MKRSPDESYTQTRGNLIYFNNHKCLSRSEYGCHVRVVTIYTSGQTVFNLSHIEGITLGAGEEVDEIAGGASAMGSRNSQK